MNLISEGDLQRVYPIPQPGGWHWGKLIIVQKGSTFHRIRLERGKAKSKPCKRLHGKRPSQEHSATLSWLRLTESKQHLRVWGVFLLLRARILNCSQIPQCRTSIISASRGSWELWLMFRKAFSTSCWSAVVLFIKVWNLSSAHSVNQLCSPTGCGKV